MDFLWVGTNLLQPQAGDRWTVTGTKLTVVTTYKGTYTDCLNLGPDLGQAIEDFPGMFVTQAEIDQLEGNAGELHVTLEGMVDPSTLTFAPLGLPIFELEFVCVVRPLEQHPLCGILKPARPISSVTQKQLTWEDWPLLTDNDYDDTGTGTGIWSGLEKWGVITYRAKKEKGEDSYEVFAPVVRRTTIHLYPPSDVGSASGMIQAPPSSGFDVSNWQFLAGPDRCTRSERSFTRVTEWHGAESIDDDIYASA